MEMETSSDLECSLIFDWKNAESIPAAVIDAVCTATEEEPTEMEPLYSAVDPDALEGFFESIGQPQRPLAKAVEFSYNGFLVQISEAGSGYLFKQW